MAVLTLVFFFFRIFNNIFSPSTANEYLLSIEKISQAQKPSEVHL